MRETLLEAWIACQRDIRQCSRDIEDYTRWKQHTQDDYSRTRYDEMVGLALADQAEAQRLAARLEPLLRRMGVPSYHFEEWA